MSTLPAVRDARDAAGLVRELFRTPPVAALELAAPGDPGTNDAVLRYLQVALRDLPPDQSAFLSEGAALLLAEPSLAGQLVCLLESADTATVREAAAAAVAGGELRGMPLPGTDVGDVHAMVLGLCARHRAPVPWTALVRDAADPRYRDLVLLLAAGEALSMAAVLPVAAGSIEATDSYAIEALGRAFQEALQRQGEGGVLSALDALPAAAAPVLLGGLQEAPHPWRLSLLDEAQRARDLDALPRAAEEEDGDDYVRLRLDGGRSDAFVGRVRAMFAR